jgi:hypothetical protein
MNARLHSVLLTLWDIARDNPDYDRRLWGELQQLLSQLETRNNVLCALLSDLLRATDEHGNVEWERTNVMSPPEGYAIKFMREELGRGRRPTIPHPPETIPTNARGEAVDPLGFETRATPRPPALPKRGTSANVPRPRRRSTDDASTTSSQEEDGLTGDLLDDHDELNPSPHQDAGEYDGLDESGDELTVDLGSSDDLIL